MGSFSENAQIAIDSFFRNQYDYIFLLEDIQGHLWSVEGTALNFKLDYQGKKLEYETEMIVKKKDDWWWWVPFL